MSKSIVLKEYRSLTNAPHKMALLFVGDTRLALTFSFLGKDFGVGSIELQASNFTGEVIGELGPLNYRH